MVTVIQPLLSERETEALKRILDHLADEESDYISLSPEERSKHIFSAVLDVRAGMHGIWTLFDSDRTCSTPGAEEALIRAKQQPWEFFIRHQAGDWGDVSAEDWRANALALVEGLPLMSVYRTARDEQVWVTTDAGRCVTTLLLPSEA